MEKIHLVSIAEISETQRKKALERYQIIDPIISKRKTISEIAKKYGLTERTLWRWIKCYNQAGLSGLCTKSRSDNQKRRIPEDLQNAIEGLALQVPKLSAAEIQRRAKAVADKLNVKAPSYTTILEILQDIAPSMKMLAHQGTKFYNQQFDLIYRTEAPSPNAIWQADHTQLDVIVKGNDSKPWLTIIIDDYSRAIAGYALSFSAPSALQTALALRYAIWRKPHPDWLICGIPDVLYTDHGSDFTSDHLQQVAADIKMQLIYSAVGKPRGRGKIERFFRSLNQMFLPSIPGNQPPGQKKAPGALSIAQLAREIEDYIVHKYHPTQHRSTKQPPQERWISGGFLPRMPDSLAQLDLLLLTVPHSRKVRMDGIHFMGLRYIDATLAAYVGENVVLRYDPRDMAEVRIFYGDKFLCKAVCQELAGETVPLKEIVTARRRRERELRQKIQDRSNAVEMLFLQKKTVRTDEKSALPPKAPPSQKPSQKLKLYQTDL